MEQMEQKLKKTFLFPIKIRLKTEIKAEFNETIVLVRNQSSNQFHKKWSVSH